jgi:hypothetical protein
MSDICLCLIFNIHLFLFAICLIVSDVDILEIWLTEEMGNLTWYYCVGVKDREGI